MKKLGLLLIMISLITCSGTTNAATKEMKNATVGIFNVGNGGFGKCSGVVIEDVNGIAKILTAKHCIDIYEEVYVEQEKVKLMIASSSDDLALLIVNSPILYNKQPAKLASLPPTSLDTVTHLGYPHANAKIYESQGTLFKFTEDWTWYNLDVIGGCSGGPIFNEKSELVGILWGGTMQNLAIAESLNDIKKFLTEIDEYTK